MESKITRLEFQILKSARNYLENNNYIEIAVPRMTKASGACENIDTLFEVSVDNNFTWFNRDSRTYLAQTGQLYLEAFVPFLKKVYCVGPSFRAEPKVDSRHLTEFQMIEIELSTDFEGLLEEIEGLLKEIIFDIQKLSYGDLLELGVDPKRMKFIKCPVRFPRLTYDQAIENLQKLGITIDWGDDISRERERLLLQGVDNQPLFITHYPDPMWNHGKEIEVEKFFNMLPDPENPGRVLSCDLLLPFGGEAVGAAARVHKINVLVKRLENSRMFERLKTKGGSLKDFRWYIEQVKMNGAIPHAGCGFGLARIVQWIKGSNDIRECTTFPSNKEILI